MLTCRENLIAALLSMLVLSASSQAFGFGCWNKRSNNRHSRIVCRCSCLKPLCADSNSRNGLNEHRINKNSEKVYLLPDGRVDMSGVPDEPPMTTSTPRPVVAKDPKKGKLTRRDGGALGTVVQAGPWAKNNVIFMMIKHNLNIYDAVEGHFPRSHEEFMEKFLPQYYPAALPLPELEAGDEYIYDPEDHLLKIYRPDG